MDAHTTITYGTDKDLTKIDTVISDARPALQGGVAVARFARLHARAAEDLAQDE